MATSKATRIGIWFIAVFMLVGTIGSFAVMVLANDNQRIDEQMQQKEYDEYLSEMKKQSEENAKKSEPIESYKAVAFKGEDVTELKKEILVEGKGPVVKESDAINVSYFGWLEDGTIFDSSKKEGTDTPIDLSLMQVIPGWTEGLTGVKEGSVVKLTIPAEKGYGEAGSGVIPPNAPLQFILKIHKISTTEG